jgi:16S rRNA (cytidine1402-2'-O)-methyltransferase
MRREPVGILYLVATPIGNLADFSQRAAAVLRQCAVIAAEDTRHSRPLLAHYGIATPMISLHEHNEDAATNRLLDRLLKGEAVAVISDAGTPLISDPGFALVRRAAEADIPVVPIPGPCALIAALSASGLPADRFSFEGFPPRTSPARKAYFAALLDDRRTLIFYESSHRVVDCLTDLAASFPPERRIVIARELTKVHETITRTTVGEVPAWMQQHAATLKGEFVLLLHGASETKAHALTSDHERIVKLLLEKCSVKDTAALASAITGVSRDLTYRAALRLSDRR